MERGTELDCSVCSNAASPSWFSHTFPCHEWTDVSHTGTVRVAWLLMEAWQNELILQILGPWEAGVSSGILALEGVCYLVDLSCGGGGGGVSTYAAQQTGTARVLCVHCNLSVHRCELLPQTVPTVRHLHNTKQLGAATWTRYLHSRRSNKYRLCDISRCLYKHCSGLRGMVFMRYEHETVNLKISKINDSFERFLF